MKKILIFALVALMLAVNVFAFDITKYPSDASPDKCGATVEAYRFEYNRSTYWEYYDEDLNFVISIPKLIYETKTAAKINKKIIDDLIKKSNNFAALQNLADDGTLSDPEVSYAFSNVSYSSQIDSKGIVAIIVTLREGICYTCENCNVHFVYYYSPETDSELSVDEYLALHGTSKEKLSARFSDKNDNLKFYDPETNKIVDIPPEDIYFAVFSSDGTETVCANAYTLMEENVPLFFPGNSISAPQTGVDAVAYAAVAVVALAAAAVVVKKKRA